MSNDLPKPIIDLESDSSTNDSDNSLRSNQLNQGESKKQSPSKGKAVELLVWDAPNRQYEHKSTQWFLGLFALGLIGIVVFAILREIWLIFVTAAIVFAYYAMARVEPDDIEHKVFNTGIEVGGRFYSWKDDLKSFCIQSKKQPAILQVETKLFFPHSLDLLLPPDTPDEDLQELEDLVEAYLPIKQINQAETGSMVDSAILSLSNKLPYKQKLLTWLERRMA